MTSKVAKTAKISQFFSPKGKNEEMEGTKGKKRVAVESAKETIKKLKVQKPEKVDKRRTKKPKSDIKRGSSSYIFFSKDFRIKLTEELKKKGDPVPKVNEVAKLCGERWKQLTDEEKVPYQKLAEIDKSRYHRETGKVVNKDSEKPKRSPTAYFIFLAEFRKKMANSSAAEREGQKIPTLAGEKWRSMTDEDKKPYAKKEGEEKKKYEVAMEEYRKKIKDAPKPEKPKPKPKKREEPEVVEEDDDDDDEDDDDEEDGEAEDEDDDDDE